MQVTIEYTEAEIRKLLYVDIERKLGIEGISDKDVKIMVKTTQNYKSEWEDGQFRATVKRNVPV